MKFTDLSPAKQQLLKAFTEGETIEYYTPATGWKALMDYKTLQRYIPASGWIDTDIITLFLVSHPDLFRIKAKEPEITYLYHAIGLDGYMYSAEESVSVENLKEYYSNSKLHSFVKRTFHDGKFIKAEIVQE